MPTDFEEGVLVGLLVGEGHFGGDGRQPQVTLRMHVRHEAMFHWLERTFPGGRLYGPYNHGGRHYYQWMARGTFLRQELLPLLRRRLSPRIDSYAYDRLQEMAARYRRNLDGADAPVGSPGARSGAVPAAETRSATDEGGGGLARSDAATPPSYDEDSAPGERRPPRTASSRPPADRPLPDGPSATRVDDAFRRLRGRAPE